MIRLTLSGKLIYQLLNQVVILLLVYAIIILLADLQTLPIPSLISALSIDFTLLGARFINLLLLTGFVVAGVMMILSSLHEQRLLWVYRLWTMILVLSIVSIPFPQLDGIMNTLPALGLLAWLWLSWQAEPSRFLRIWQVGIMLIIVTILLDASPITVVFQTHVAYGITAVSITFWLMTRWSNVRDEWVHDGVLTVAGLVSLAGVLTSLAPLNLSPLYGMVGFIIAPCYMILAGHHYRALRDRNNDMSLSAHWVAMATVFWLFVGFVSVLSVQMGLQVAMAGTGMFVAQITLIQTMMLCVVLATVNFTARDLRGENRRVTGYMPFWLIGFGHGFMLMVMVSAGVVEIYLRDFAGFTAETIAVLLLPLSMIVIVCRLLIVAGIIIYALGFVARRPKIILIETPTSPED